MTAQVNKMKGINVTTKWQDLTVAGTIVASGNSIDFKTGDWRNMIPTWDGGKCIHCLLCTVVCPDSCIPVKEGKRLEFEFSHCKGCGICFKVCPPKISAITFSEEIK